MPETYIALGGNIGDMSLTFARALEAVERTPRIEVRAVSTYHQTAPVGANSGGPFLNAVARVNTDLPPLELLDSLKSIERELGRTQAAAWGPRVIDLDLIFCGEHVLDVPRLRLPHPDCWYRRFVLDPLVEIAGSFVHPEIQMTVSQLRARLMVRPLPIGIAGADRMTRNSLVRSMSDEFPRIEIDDWHDRVPQAAQNQLPLTVWLGPPPETLAPFPLGDGPLKTPSVQIPHNEHDPTQFLRDVLRSAMGNDAAP